MSAYEQKAKLRWYYMRPGPLNITLMSLYQRIFPVHLSVILPVDPIFTPTLILTGCAGTFIDVDLAVSALEASHTLALVHGHQVSTRGPVLAWVYFTLIDLHLTIHPCVEHERNGTGPRYDEISYMPNGLTHRQMQHNTREANCTG